MFIEIVYLDGEHRVRERQRKTETERERERERLMKGILEIRTRNYSLALKIVNDISRPIYPSQKARFEIASNNHSKFS